jgi:Zn-dependent M16 (insulinase) family peptidase
MMIPDEEVAKKEEKEEKEKLTKLKSSLSTEEQESIVQEAFKLKQH